MDQCGVFIQKCILCLQTFRIHHSITQWQVTQSQLTQAGFHRESSQGRVNSLVILIHKAKYLPIIFQYLGDWMCRRISALGRTLKDLDTAYWNNAFEHLKIAWWLCGGGLNARVWAAFWGVDVNRNAEFFLGVSESSQESISYCLWKKSCIKWDVTKYHVNHGINYPVNSCRISSINTGNIQGYRVLSRFQRALDHVAWVSVIQSSDQLSMVSHS